MRLSRRDIILDYEGMVYKKPAGCWKQVFLSLYLYLSLSLSLSISLSLSEERLFWFMRE